VALLKQVAAVMRGFNPVGQDMRESALCKADEVNGSNASRRASPSMDISQTVKIRRSQSRSEIANPPSK
jgi:hypothetical protein